MALAVLHRKPVGQFNAMAVFLPVESISPRLVGVGTRDQPNRSSESDFDSGGLPLADLRPPTNHRQGWAANDTEHLGEGDTEPCSEFSR